LTSMRPIIYAALALILIVAAGTFLFVKLENMGLSDALWLTMMNITTVGFGDVVPVTNAGRSVSIFLMVSGFGLLIYVISAVFSGMLEGRLADIWGKRKIMKEISRLNGHLIVCGAGRVGKEVTAELLQERQKFVVIEKDPARLEELRSINGILFISGDATEDRVLLNAGLRRAKGVISTLPEDSENLMIVIACKDFNPKARVVVRANRPESVVRLRRAGADTVVCPSAIAGNRMALASLKPASVAFVESLVEERDIDLNLEELFLSERSVLAGKMLKESRIRESYGVMILAIRRGEEDIVNPDPAEKLYAGDLLIACGSAGNLTLLEKVVAGE